MMLRAGLVWIVVATISTSVLGCQFPYNQPNYPLPPRPNTAAGSVVGGASGSLIGAAIGSQEGNTGQGALIGGLIGAATGGILGNQADRAEEWRNYNYQQQQQQRLDSAVTFSQVVQMSQSGLSSDVIVNQINRNGVRATPAPNDLILLKQSGVADEVLSALQNARRGTDPPPQRVVERFPNEPVFVERQIIVRPTPLYAIPPYPLYYRQSYPRGGYRYSHGPGAQLKIRF